MEFRDVRSIGERANQLADSICESSAECIGEQRQLNEGSRERAYWQYGYMVALRDVLRFMADNEPGRGNAPNPRASTCAERRSGRIRDGHCPVSASRRRYCEASNLGDMCNVAVHFVHAGDSGSHIERIEGGVGCGLNGSVQRGPHLIESVVIGVDLIALQRGLLDGNGGVIRPYAVGDLDESADVLPVSIEYLQLDECRFRSLCRRGWAAGAPEASRGLPAALCV